MFPHPSFICLLLPLRLLLTRSSEDAYLGEVGKNAYLPCSYTPSTPGTLMPVCWGRGYCPLSQCDNMVLRTDKRNVTYQKSGRYQLKGEFHRGDVSLTIKNVTLADQGTYCCRIEVPGPMNDRKVNLELIIQPAKVTPAGTAQGDFTTALPGTFTSEGNGSETQTFRSLYDKNQTQIFTLADELKNAREATRTSIYIGAGVSAGLLLALIISALILKWYSHKKKKLQNSSLVTLADFPPVGLSNAAANRMQSEENIYIIEENVYEVENSNEYYRYVSSGRPSCPPWDANF